MSGPQAAALRQAIADDLPRLTDLLQRLVRCVSLPGEEAAAQEVVMAEMTSLGLDPVFIPVRFDELRDHPAFGDDGFSADGRVDVIGTWHASDGPSLVLNGHVDVVPAGRLDRWSAPPFSGATDGRLLHGRGSCDMKAGLVAALGAIAALQRSGFQPGGRVVVHSVVGEETGGAGTLAALINGYVADAALILEPTGLRSCPVQSGATTFRLRVFGRATHAATRHAGISALDRFMPLLPVLAGLEQRRQTQVAADVAALYDDPQGIAPLSVGTVRCGDWHSTVPDELVAEGRLGVLPGEPVRVAQQAFEDAVAASGVDGVAVEWIEAPFESGATPLDDPFLAALRAAHREAHGAACAVGGVPYGSDLRLFTNHAAMPAVLYGPGDVRWAHAIDERVELDELAAAALTTALLIARWCGAA